MSALARSIGRMLRPFTPSYDGTTASAAGLIPVKVRTARSALGSAKTPKNADSVAVPVAAAALPVSEAAVSLGADAATRTTGLTGAGVKIGIISDSFDALGGATADEACGALASSVDIVGDSDQGHDEGRAMAEVAHGVAPGADIAFCAAGGSLANLASAIASLQAAGCTVICDDVTFADEPFFQMGDVAEKAISAFTAAGGVYLTAASNAGPASSYEARFSGVAAVLPGVGAVTAMNFGTAAAPRTTTTLNLTADHRTKIDLQWAQPWASIDGVGSAYSLAVAIYDPDGKLVKTFDADHVGGDAVQSGCFKPTVSGAYTVAVYVDGGSDPGGTFKIVADNDALTPARFERPCGSGSVFGHNMDPDAITVGAVAAHDTPAYGGTLRSETFGAAGPGEAALSDDGVPLAAARTLDAVDVSGPDGIATSLPSSLGTFYGTSCAAPAVAGVVALMKQANPSLNAGEIKAELKASALAFGDADQSGAGLVQAPGAVALARESNTAIHADVFGDGRSALLWRGANGGARISTAAGAAATGTSALSSPEGTGWSAVATGDFSGAAGHSDILWRNADGRLLVGAMDGASTTSRTVIGDPGAQWKVVGTGDFDGDGDSDILLQSRGGDVDVMTMDGTAVRSRTAVEGPGAGWTAAGIGDFDGDGRSDILWRDGSGALAAWIMDGTSVASELSLGSMPGAGWTVAGVGDLTGDGRADILLQSAAGDAVDLWAMDGTGVTSNTASAPDLGAGWRAMGLGAFDGSGQDGVLFQNAATGGAAVADVSQGRIGPATAITTPGRGWTALLA